MAKKRGRPPRRAPEVEDVEAEAMYDEDIDKGPEVDECVGTPIDAAEGLNGPAEVGVDAEWSDVPAAPIGTPLLPTLLDGQKYFEAPDGRVLAGPAEASCIPDPENDGRTINPMRKPSPQLHQGNK